MIVVNVKALLTAIMVIAMLPLGPQEALGRPATPPAGKSVELLIFRSENCPECEPVHESLKALQAQVGEKRLTITRHLLEDETHKEAFTQHQVTQLPEYILLDENHEILFGMRHTIQYDELLWEVKEALGENPKVTLPKPLAQQLEEAPSHAPLVLLFWRWTDPRGQTLSLQVTTAHIQVQEETPAVYSFNPDEPEVAAWMKTLGLSPDEPGYLILTPRRTVYRQSTQASPPWQLKADLMAYSHRFNSTLQTILAGLNTPLPGDEAILPATMEPSPPLASPGMFHPEQ